MATRGSYRVEGKMMYNHWDNYPAGAASHLQKVITEKHTLKWIDFVKCTAEGLNFEPMEGRPGDMGEEYFYKITKEKGMYFVEWSSIGWETNELVFLGKKEVSDFINDEFKKELKQDRITQTEYNENKIVKYPNKWSKSVSYYSYKYLQEYTEKKFNLAMRWLLKGMVGNASSDLQWCAQSWLLLGDTKMLEGYNKMIAPYLAQCYKHNTPDHFTVSEEIINNL